MTRRLRLMWVGLLVLMQAMYHPLNHVMQGGTVIRLSLDDYVPFWPAWIVPYILCQPLWIGSLLWAALKMPARLFRATLIATAAAILTGTACFFFYPTYILRPTPVGDDVFSRLLLWVFEHDRPYNAFPSAHVYLAVVAVLVYCRWRPRRRVWWIAAGGVICLSALFTGQHHLPDVIAGVVVGCVAYRFGLWCMGESAWSWSRGAPASSTAPRRR